MTAKFEKITAKEARKAEKGRMPAKQNVSSMIVALSAVLALLIIPFMI